VGQKMEDRCEDNLQIKKNELVEILGQKKKE
jgi:hypothetical protein